MVTYKGYNTNVRYVAETSFGTGGVIGTAIGGKVTSFNPTLNNNLKRTQGLGEGRNATVTQYGNLDATGTIEYEVADFTFLQFLIGAMSGSGTIGSPYVLTESENIDYSTMSTFKMEVTSEDAVTDDSDVYTGCHLTEGNISANEGEIMKGTANWVAKTVTSSTAGTVAYSPSTIKPWMFWQGTLKYGAAPSAVAKVTSFSLTVNNNSQIYRALGSRLIQQPEFGIRTYDFTITVKMSDAIATTMRDDFYGQVNTPIDNPASSNPITGRKLQLDLTEGAGSGARQGTIYLDEVNFNDIAKPVTLGEGIVEVTINGYARKAGNTAKPFSWYTNA
jgi:hypothetical protein